MTTGMIRSGFAALLEQIAKERNITPEKVIESIEQAIEAAIRKDMPELFLDEVEDDESTLVKIAVELDREDGSARVFKIDGDSKTDITPPGFGRIASQTAKNVIFQKVREFERSAMLEDFSSKFGTIMQGTVIRYDGRNTVIDLGRGQAIMPPEEQMRGEFYKPNVRLTVLIKNIAETMRGEQVIVSRADPQLVVKLFEREVPEMSSGAVLVKAIAREAGVRTKIAVASDQSGVDPVGSCVGQRGIRVQEVIRELNNEKIDIIQWSDDMPTFIKSALAPAEGMTVEIVDNGMWAIVTVPEDQTALAIGRGGQNVRLAAKVTGLGITIKTAAGSEAMKVSGKEQFELDQVDGISAATRQLLIDHRATTRDDLLRKWNELQLKPEITADQRSILQTLVDDHKAKLAEEDALRAV